MIEAKQLIKQFGKLRALDGLSIQVPEGSIYGLVGPNGAGKSTLIRCLTGVYRPEGSRYPGRRAGLGKSWGKKENSLHPG